MPQFLVAIHHPDDFDSSQESDATRRDISALNVEMKAAGVRFYANGLMPVRAAKSIRVKANNQLLVTDGPYLETKEHIGGFWILDCADMDEALEWGRKAALACRAPTEVRPFHPPMPG